MTESLLRRNDIFEILAPTVGGAFLFSYVFSKYFGFLNSFKDNLLIFSVSGILVLLLYVLFLNSNKYILFALAVFSSALTVVLLTENYLLPLLVASVAACFLFVLYFIEDKLYSSLIMILSVVLLVLVMERGLYLQLNRVVLIIATSLFMVPKILRYEKDKGYNKFVVMTVIVPVVAAFVTENIGYNRFLYGVAFLSTVSGVGFFKNAYKFKKTV
jgi:hypothetical protein